MGDKSPKAASKQASQKQTKTDAGKQKKQLADDAKKEPPAKK